MIFPILDLALRFFCQFISSIDGFAIQILYFEDETIAAGHLYNHPSAGQIISLGLWALLCQLALEGTVQHALILDRKGHGDTKLPVLLHGALDGLISVDVSRPAAAGHLRQGEPRLTGLQSELTASLPVSLTVLSPRWRRPSLASDWHALPLHPNRPTANQTLR